MNKKLVFFFFNLLFLIPILGGTQNSILDNYIKKALENNLSIKGAALNKNKQLVKIEQARKNWMPSVDGNATYLLSEGGRTLVFPIGDLFNPVYGALNNLTQSNNFPVGLENEKIALTPNHFLDVQIKVTQPLVNSAFKYNILIQKELIKLNDLEIQIQEREITFQTKVAYYNYLKTIEGIKILEETEKLLLDLLSFNQKLVKHNKATGEIISDVEFQLAKLESEKALLNEQQGIAKTYFNIVLNRAIDQEIDIQEGILQDFLIEEVDLQTSIDKAFQARQEFKKIQIANSINDLNENRIDKEKMPTLGLTGAVGIQTEGFSTDTGGPIYTLGVGMAVNIYDGGRRKKRIEEINVDQNILMNNRAMLQQQIKIEVSQIYFAIQSLKSKLQSDQAASQSASKTYAIIKSKYENDKAIWLQVNDAQNKLITSNLRATLTKYDYLIKLAELEKVTQ